MTAALAVRRRRAALGLAAATAAMAALSLFSAVSSRGGDSAERSGELVFPGFADRAAEWTALRVRLADDAYMLERDGETWRLVEAGRHPVRPERMTELAQGLAELRWAEAKTTDPDKFDRLGLGDPAEGGAGAFIEASTAAGDVIGALITGRRTDRIYGRRPDETRAFRLRGDLPPLYTRSAWLDLKAVDMAASVVEAVRLTDEAGEELFLRRPLDRSDRAFRPGPPNDDDQLIDPLAANAAALALTRLAPIDVKPKDALATTPVARHVTSTLDGLEVEALAFREPDGLFITLYAVEAGEGAVRASTINAKAEGWAYELSERDWREFAAPVGTIVRRP
ncbi:MAG: DUF4340 domain-containing protein [Pseudomonadota bacterium]